DRWISQRHVWQRTGADHRVDRRRPWPRRGGPRLLDGKRRRKPPARARGIAAGRRKRHHRPSLDVAGARVDRGGASALPDPRDPNRHSLAVASLPVAIVLLVLYAVVTWRSLRRHAALHESDGTSAGWSLRGSLGVLAIATAATALVAEILVGSIEDFADKLGLTDFFVAAVIVA